MPFPVKRSIIQFLSKWGLGRQLGPRQVEQFSNTSLENEVGSIKSFFFLTRQKWWWTVSLERRGQKEMSVLCIPREREEHWCDLGQIKRPLLGLGT